MTSREYEILTILADGNLHSGQEMAEKTGISRTAVWKQLNNIRQKNLQVHAIKGKGYQFPEAIDLLDKNKIRPFIEADCSSKISKLENFYQIASTNQYLLDQLPTDSIHGRVAMAEYQSLGRGRGSNRWVSCLSSGLYLSIGWHFSYLPKTFSALSLAIGAVLSNSLSDMLDISVGLKWPNDLVYKGSKLGGVLIESRGQHAGNMDVVVGIGLNVNLPEHIKVEIRQDVTDIKSICGFVPSRNEMAGRMISNILELLSEYPQQGFTRYLDDWRKRDISRGRQASLVFAGKIIEGKVVDVDEEGNLIMSINGKLEKFISGDLSLRLN